MSRDCAFLPLLLCEAHTLPKNIMLQTLLPRVQWIHIHIQTQSENQSKALSNCGLMMAMVQPRTNLFFLPHLKMLHIPCRHLSLHHIMAVLFLSLGFVILTVSLDFWISLYFFIEFYCVLMPSCHLSLQIYPENYQHPTGISNHSLMFELQITSSGFFMWAE